MERGDEVAHVQDPDDLVERFPVHRITGVRGLEHGAERLLGRHLDGDPDHVGPGTITSDASLSAKSKTL